MRRFRVPVVIALVAAIFIYVGVVVGAYALAIHEGEKTERERINLRMKGMVAYLEDLLYDIGDAPISMLTAFGRVDIVSSGFSRLIIDDNFDIVHSKKEVEATLKEFINYESYADDAYFYFNPGVFGNSVFQPYVAQGDTACSVADSHYDIAHGYLYNKVQEHRHSWLYVSDENFASKKTVLTMCTPIYLRDTTNFIGVFVFDFLLDSLDSRMCRQKMYNESDLFIINSKGRIIAQTSDTDYFGCTLDDLPPSDEEGIGNSSERFSTIPWTLRMYTPEDRVSEYLRNFFRMYEAIGLGGLLLLVPCIIFVIRYIRRTTKRDEVIAGELAMAGTIQRSLLPSALPDCPGIKIDTFLRPAKEVAGDVYEVHRVGGNLFFMIGDVSGKGIQASLLMAMTSGILRSKMREISSPAAIVTAINHDFAERNPELFFCTMLVGLLDLSTGELTLCNAGHNPPLINGEFLKLLPQKPIGIIPDYEYKAETFRLSAGETFLCYTDGVTEATDIHNRLFGEQRLKSCKQDVGNVIKAVDDFVGEAEQSDDITMLSIHFERLTIGCVDEIDRLHPFMQTFGTLPPMTELAVEEAMTNSLTHGEADWATVYRAPDRDGHVVFVVEDNGLEFDVNAYELPPSLSEQGGQGISLMRQIAHKMTYIRIDSQINSLTIEI